MFRVSGLACKLGLQGFGLKNPTVQGCFLGVVIRYGSFRNRGPEYSTLNSRILIIRTPKSGTLIFGNSHIGIPSLQV